MFNLPWYAWLNVLALPCLWGVTRFEGALAARSPWFGRLATVQTCAAIACLFLYWNRSPGEGPVPLYLVLAALILPRLVWQLGDIVLGAVEIARSAYRLRARGANGADASGGPRPDGGIPGAGPRDVEILADVVDLDAGAGERELTEETVGAWVELLFHRGDAASRRDSLRTIFPEPDEDELGRDAPVFLGTSLAYGALVLAVLGPPAWMSLSMANLLG